MLDNEGSQMDVLSVLVSANRKDLGKAFGVGLYITDSDTAEQVKDKCRRYIDRYNKYITNLNKVLEIPEDELKSEMQKAKACRFIKSLTDEDKAALKELFSN